MKEKVRPELKVVEIPLAQPVKKPVTRTVKTYHPRFGYIKKEVTK